MRRPGTRFANLLTVFLLAGCITLAIWGAYRVQLYFQQQEQTNFLSTAATTGDSSQHQITGISAANLYDLNGSEASGGERRLNYLMNLPILPMVSPAIRKPTRYRLVKWSCFTRQTKVIASL